ncbi:hypothetical protein B0H17DRAFT_1331988 [Mycena rosella]|uniref:DUF6589 domain-containing protein n=1 Tax=Mycena rosella TaxID=1033263 RepID=A0AAD7DD27_MYCRO|nr:hypothetical protein B0H17DRAFT_1331988 [Mycena rosella]
MAESSAFVPWAGPMTPAAVKQPLTSRNGGHSAAQSARKGPNGISRPLDIPHFYGNIQFGSIRTPERPFDYSPPKKRSRATSQANENAAPSTSTSSSSPRDPDEPPEKRRKATSALSQSDTESTKRKSPRTDAQKIETILEAIQAQGWTLGRFMYNLFRTKDTKGDTIHRSPSHSQMVSIFLAGRGRKTVANIITQWMAHPDGRIPADSLNADLMYSTTVPYTEIKPVRAALTAFSTQIIGKKVGDEAESAVQLSSGLHVSIGSKHPETKLRREDFGEKTIPRVQSVIEREQPVTLYLFNKIAMRKPRKREGVVIQRKMRPAETASDHPFHRITQLLSHGSSKSAAAHARNFIFRLLRAGRVDELQQSDREYACPRHNSPGTHQSLAREARTPLVHGQDPETAGFLFVDNTQNYHRQRDLRIGRETVMNVGMSGLYMEAPDVDVNVFNLADKRVLIEQNRRKDLSVDDLLGYLDQTDADLTGTLMFLESLEVDMRLSATAKIMMPSGQAIVHPLACSGKKQTITTELKDGMLDFFQQIGQTPDAYLKRKLPVGGDGLTYAMLQQLQTYLQFHNDAFKSFEIMEPQLSAAKIGRSAPANMKKVEFYTGTQLLYLVLDAKLLDIWRLAFKTDDIFVYFEELERTGKLPDMETLLPMARKLYRAYGTARGRDHAMHDTGMASEWAQTVPAGTPWVPQEIEDSSLDLKKRKGTKKALGSATQKTRKAKQKPVPEPCLGDFVLAQGIDFIRDGINSRKLMIFVARGDIGRLYECLKVDDRDTDDFARGVKKLREGALQTAVTKSTSNRQVFRTDAVTPPAELQAEVIVGDSDVPRDAGEDTSEDTSEDPSDSESDDGLHLLTLSLIRSHPTPIRTSFHCRVPAASTRLGVRCSYVVDGELIFDERDILVGPEDEEYSESGNEDEELDED